MARFNASNINNYGGSGGSGYFSLKDDGDVATVRFLYNNEEDVEGYAVHQVEVDGRKRYVNCLREYNDPISACPFCQRGEFQMAKLFIPVYNEDTKKVQVWERGKKFFNKISGICARYGSKNDIVSQTFDIQRNGAKGDTNTTYEIFRTDDAPDDKTLDDFEMPNILGSIVLDKSAEDMEFYLDKGYFPAEDDVPRRSSSKERDEEEAPRRRRRTPADSF